MTIPTLIGSHLPGSFNFMFGDSEELFRENKTRLDKSWHWYNSEGRITYNINSSGFRMNKELDQIDLDNYFISLGCSFAFGLGLPHNDIYTQVLSQRLGCDAVLLATPGHGMDTFFHNFFTWIETYKKPPKFVILGHSSADRKTYWFNDIPVMYISDHFKNSGKHRDVTYKEFLLYETSLYVDYKVKRLAIKSYCDSSNIPFIEFTGFQKQKLLNDLGISYLNVDRVNLPMARDRHIKDGLIITHPGYEFQQNVVRYVLQELNI